MKRYKTPLTVRGDSLYCPLCLSLDPYWGCEPDCLHCSHRGLNHVWGKELRVADPNDVRRKLQSGLRNPRPKKTPLAWCLYHKKTIRMGSKSDAFQPVEDEVKASERILRVLVEMEWSCVIETRFATRAWAALLRATSGTPAEHPIYLMPVVSPGLDKDWEIFELRRTDPPEERLAVCKEAARAGVRCTVNGEPFIPGFHTEKDFRRALELLKDYGLRSYSTYNFHFTPFVAKRLAPLKEVDLEKIWYYNQDDQWYKILQRLIQIAEEEGVQLACPDFVNTGFRRREPFNTCCGIDVPNPATFNTHHFKRLLQDGLSPEEILEETYDGSGDYEEGRRVVYGKATNKYTLRDIKGWKGQKRYGLL